MTRMGKQFPVTNYPVQVPFFSYFAVWREPLAIISMCWISLTKYINRLLFNVKLSECFVEFCVCQILYMSNFTKYVLF